MSEPVDGPVDNPYVPLVVPADPARDKRVAARRAADAARYGAALDKILGYGPGGRGWPSTAVLREAGRAYADGWSEGYAASNEHHNGHYGVPEEAADVCRRCGVDGCSGKCS